MAATLFIFHMEGCHTCAALRPLFREFRDQQQHRIESKQLDIQTYDITRVVWGAKGWIPRITPTLVVITEEMVRGREAFNPRRHIYPQGTEISEEGMKQWLNSWFP